MKASPEPIILAVALGLLALGAAGMAYTFPSVEDITGGVSSLEPVNSHKLQALKSEDLEASLAPWTSPGLWNEPADKHRLFISDGILFYATLYPDGNYIQKDDGTARTPGGVLLSWYRKYALDFTDPNIDRADPDGDGFSNKVEFVNGVAKAADCDGSKSTNPLDPQSHPSYIDRLRLQKYESRQFHIQFRGYQQLNGEFQFQIYLKDVPSSNQPRLKKSGDQLGFEGYIIGPFKQNIVEEEDPATHVKAQVDESTLELDKPEIGLKIALPFRKEIDSPELTADFVMLMPTEVDKVIKIARGKIFTAPYISSTSFLVIDTKDSGATIRDTKTNQDYTIPKLDPAEWDDVPVPAPVAAPKTP